jgi:SAM-dependent methyltransferase
MVPGNNALWPFVSRSMLVSVGCCDPNGLNQMFAGSIVQEELRTYRRHGLNKRQQQIIKMLEPLALARDVLDIGCGLGAVGTTLLKRSVSQGTFVDISGDYLRAAREVADDAGVGERATFVQDDFATSLRPYSKADVVVLDRVVCCYPDAITLLEKAARHSDKALVFTYPRPFWFMPLFRALCALSMKVMRREYRFFLHDPEVLLEAATSSGHKHEETRTAGMWRMVTLQKVL